MSKEVGYASVKPVINPNNNVLSALTKLKLPKGISLIPIEKLHCTLMYDERNNQPEPSIPPEVYPANVMGVAVLGKAVVLLLSSDTLMKRHFELVELGFSYSHSNYAPHISIVYADGDSVSELEQVRVQVQKELTEHRLPNELYFTDETWSVCD